MRFFYRPRCLPSVTATGPLLRCNEGVPGSGWRDVKEQYFEVNKRQKIAVARKAGKEEDQAGDLQGGPVVRKCRDVHRNCRPPEGSTGGSGAHSTRQGPGRLSGPDRRNVRRKGAHERTRRWNLPRVCGKKTAVGLQRPRPDRRGDPCGCPVRVLSVQSVARGAQTGGDHKARPRPLQRPNDGLASISACVRCLDLAAFDRAFPEAAALRWAK